jgi:hypothetical protein
MTKKYTLGVLLACGVFALGIAPVAVDAAGTNADDVSVTVKAKQGGKWITAREENADDDGVLEMKNVLPGKYRFQIDEDDQTAGQTLGVKARMLDDEGRRIKDNIDVDAYIYIAGVKVAIATYTTDNKGWIELAGITHDTTYELDVRGDGHVSKKDNRPRIKVKTKIDNSDWFEASYQRLDSNGILHVDDVITGKYKFKYKSTDNVNPLQPFTLHARLRHDNGKKIKEPTKVKLYVYMMGMRQKVGEMKTDSKGYITIPGMMTGMKYKIKVSDRK